MYEAETSTIKDYSSIPANSYFSRYGVCPRSVYTDMNTTAMKANEHSVDWPKNYLMPLQRDLRIATASNHRVM